MPKTSDNPWLNSMAGMGRKAKREAMGYSMVGTMKTIPNKKSMVKTLRTITAPKIVGVGGSRSLKAR